VDFLTSAEYRTLVANSRDLPILAGDIVVKSSDDGADTEPEGDQAAPEAPAERPKKPAAAAIKEVRLKSMDELVDYFITAGRKGIAVNRYKGLGEMNPDQLWETTMNPEARTLLQVRAEDHTEADLMFTTLMGDQVEPRRKFIEDNALDVKNLDV
jgi:DNA gyrase subunit B